MDYEDFKQQAMILALEVYNKLSPDSSSVISDDEFSEKVVWAIRTYCWGNRDKIRGKDIGVGDENNTDAVVTVNFEDIADFYIESESKYSQAAYRKHEIMAALLSYLTVTESEYLSEYLGLGDLPKLTMKEIASRRGISESAVSQLISKAKEKLIKLLKSAGIDSGKTQEEIAETISKMYLSESYSEDYEYKSYPVEYMEYEFIKVKEPFRSVCPVSEQMVYSVAKSIKSHGYDQSQPLIIWKELGVLIDGHTRLEALKLMDYPGKVPVIPTSFPDMRSALAYMLNIQYNRRNVKDADIINSAERIFRLFHSDGKKRSDKEKTMLLAKVCAELPMVKIKKVVTLLGYANDEEKSSVNDEKLTINELYNNLRGRFAVKKKEGV
jgi:ParB-like chromosome segregation protein Spo0J